MDQEFFQRDFHDVISCMFFNFSHYTITMEKKMFFLANLLGIVWQREYTEHSQVKTILAIGSIWSIWLKSSITWTSNFRITYPPLIWILWTVTEISPYLQLSSLPVGKYASHLGHDFSSSLVIITIAGTFSHQTIDQKSMTVFGRGPWVAINAFSSPNPCKKNVKRY